MIRWPRLRPRHRRTRPPSRSTGTLPARVPARNSRAHADLDHAAGRALPARVSRASREARLPDVLSHARNRVRDHAAAGSAAGRGRRDPVLGHPRAPAWDGRRCRVHAGAAARSRRANGDRCRFAPSSRSARIDAVCARCDSIAAAEVARRRAADWLRRRALHDGDVSGRRPRHEDIRRDQAAAVRRSRRRTRFAVHLCRDRRPLPGGAGRGRRPGGNAVRYLGVAPRAWRLSGVRVAVRPARSLPTSNAWLSAPDSRCRGSTTRETRPVGSTPAPTRAPR